MKNSEISYDQRKEIVRLHCTGYSNLQIAATLNLSKSTVQYSVAKWNEHGTVHNLPRKGRPRITSLREDTKLCREVKKNPLLSARSVSRQSEDLLGHKVSRTTVRSRLSNSGLVCRAATKKPLLSARQRERRLKFAKAYLGQPLEFWNKVIWSDESKFSLRGSDGPPKTWRPKGKTLGKGMIRETVKHGGGSVMVWGCFSSKGMGNLVLIEGIVKKEQYRSILEQNLLESAVKMGLSEDFVFQQDNDPKHTSKVVQDYLREAHIFTLEWPSNSPDLNPIEHIWAIIKRKIGTSHSKNKRECFQKIEKAWKEIGNEEIGNLVNSMKSRCLAVIASKGGCTKY